VLVVEPSSSGEPAYTLDEISPVGSFLPWLEYDVVTLRIGADWDLTDAATIAADALPAFSLRFTNLFDESVVIASSELATSLVPRRPVFHSVIHYDDTIENCSLIRLETMAVPISKLSALSGTIDSLAIIPSTSFPRRLFITSLQLVRY
jgi:hypothetical protein